MYKEDGTRLHSSPFSFITINGTVDGVSVLHEFWFSKAIILCLRIDAVSPVSLFLKQRAMCQTKLVSLEKSGDILVVDFVLKNSTSPLPKKQNCKKVYSLSWSDMVDMNLS